MSRFEDNLWGSVVEAHGDALALCDAPAARSARSRSPRLLAGGTLGLAGVGAALVVALSAGGAAAPPALAVTRQADGSVLVNVNVSNPDRRWINAADAKLATMGIDESINIQTAPGPASDSGPVSCKAAGGGVSTPVQVQLGSDGTQVIPSGDTGAGTVHLSACWYYQTGNYPSSLDGTVSPGATLIPPTGAGTGNSGNG